MDLLCTNCQWRPQQVRSYCLTCYNQCKRRGDLSEAEMQCLVEGCSTRSRHRGYCSRCYARLRRQGILDLLPPTPATCDIDGCEKPPKAKGLCFMHEARLRIHGHPGDAAPLRPRRYLEGTTCAVEWCQQSPACLGWCTKHYERWRDHGDPLITLIRPHGSGSWDRAGYLIVRAPNHPLATAAGYVRVHRLVLYASIGPGAHPCHWCQQLVYWDKQWPRDGDDALLVDHVDRNRQNNDLENLVPSCHSCNVSRPRLVPIVETAPAWASQS